MHAVLRLVQIPLNKYINANKQALVKKVEEYHNKLNNIQRVRAVTADFTQTVKDAIDGLKTRCKNAKNRGDTTADDKRLHEAIGAFNKVWLK
jgi:flagellar hook-basal body complex protein FliE